MEKATVEHDSLFHNLNKRTKGALDTVLIENNICPLCILQNTISELVIRNGERLCTNCGFVADAFPVSFTLHDGPRISLRGKRVNELAYNRGLGGTLQEKGQFCVLARSIGVQDLPIRSRQITTIIERFENPKIRNMLRLGAKRCKEWGIADNQKSNQNIIFSNYLGKVLRRIGAYMILTNDHVSQKLVDACFLLTLKVIKGEKAFDEALEKLDVEPALVQAIRWIYQISTFPPKTKRATRVL